ncbi:uncharacterized protein BCR38DRAFT_324244, partial [Pseudomassariella vexata]
PAESNASSHHVDGRDASAPATTCVEDQRNKKRRIGAGSRGVANLTPEQLAKKRANDREAQRAIRERTKNQIETLEQRIRELTSQKPYQDLQSVIRAKEAVEAENADIRSRLASVIALIQPLLSGLCTASPPQPKKKEEEEEQVHAIPSVDNVSTPSCVASPAASASADPAWHQGGLHSASSSIHASPSLNQVQIINQLRSDQVHNLDFGSGEHLKLGFLLDPLSAQRVNRMQTGGNGAQDPANYQHLPTRHNWNGVSFPSTRPGALESSSVSDGIGSHLAPLKNCAPTCTLDNILLEFLSERRQRAAEGIPTQEIVGPRYPSVSSLLNPANSAFSHPLSKIFTDILVTFPGICTLPEKIAVLYIMFLIMRWQISPTQENYNLLPPWVQPRPVQFYTSHPAWIDHLPFPRMREKIATGYNPKEYLFENFFIPFTSTICLNWPYEPTDTLLQIPDGDELIINPVFERHLRRLENWTLGEAFHQMFPQLKGTYNLK